MVRLYLNRVFLCLNVEVFVDVFLCLTVFILEIFLIKRSHNSFLRPVSPHRIVYIKKQYLNISFCLHSNCRTEVLFVDASNTKEQKKMLGWAWNRFLNCVFSEGIRYIRFVFAGFNVGAEHCFDATEDDVIHTACYCYDQFLANLIYQIIG